MADESRPIKLRPRVPGATTPAAEDRSRRAAPLALAAALVVAAAGVAGAIVVDADDATDPTAAEVIAERLPPGYVVVGVLENDVRYEITAAAAALPADRFVVTIYRRFDPTTLDDDDLPRRVVNDDQIWTGFDEPDLRAVYLRAANGVGLRISHQGPTARTVDDLTAIARTLHDHPTVAAEAG